MPHVRQLAQRRTAVTGALATIAALLVMTHVGWQLFKHWTGHDYVRGLIKLFHLDEERNIPALFSTLLLLTAAALLAWIRRQQKLQGSRDVAKWTVLALGFAYIAIDEFGHIHENLILPGRELLGDGAPGIFHYAWVVPATAIVLGLAVYFTGFLLRLPAPTRLGFIVAGMLFVGGAIGFEMLEGRHDRLYGEHNLAYMAYVTVEETLEMAGVIVFIQALLHYIDRYIPVHSANAIPGAALATGPRVQVSGAAAASAKHLDPRL